MITNKDANRLIMLYKKHSIYFDHIDGIKDHRYLHQIRNRIQENTIPYLEERIQGCATELINLENQLSETKEECEFLTRILKELNNEDE